jgi:hypothetical protein
VNGSAAGTVTVAPSGAWNLALASPLSNGTFTIAARARDLFGNTSAPAEVKLVLDSVAPKLKFLSKPKKTSTERKAKFKFSASEQATFECKLDKGKFKPCKSPYVTKLKPGKHTLQVVATDSAGNKSDPNKASWDIKKNVK